MGDVYFWDPTKYDFRFGLDKLCPTYGEFSWFLGQAKDLLLVVLRSDVGGSSWGAGRPSSAVYVRPGQVRPQAVGAFSAEV